MEEVYKCTCEKSTNLWSKLVNESGFNNRSSLIYHLTPVLSTTQIYKKYKIK